MKARLLPFEFILILVQPFFVRSFLPESVNRNACRRRQERCQSIRPLFALTERQLQFWEDVDYGLDEIESYFQKKGQDLERIRTFVKSAKGEIPPPGWDSSICHEPSEEHVYGLRAQPFWEPDLFPWARKLEAGSRQIIEEYISVINRDEGGCFVGDSAWQNKVMGEGWSAIRLQRLGQWKPDVCDQFPATYTLLRSLPIPFAVRGVCFARQAPHSGVQAHSDGRNFILTAHLGLKIPTGCWIQVGQDSNKREWEEGKLTILDTSFTHSTSNPTSEERHVLIVDFWHPDLTEAEIAALTFVYDLRNKFESGAVPQRKPRSLGRAPPAKPMWWQKMTG